MDTQLRAFLDMLAFSEIGPALLAVSDNGYDVCVGSTPSNPILFQDYSHHPRLHNDAANSDAAGRYQIMGYLWAGWTDKSGTHHKGYQEILSLPDFSPASQDSVAKQLIRECGALDDIQNGHIETAIYHCRSRWASLPGAGYGQHENRIVDLLQAFRAAGGVVV